MEAQAGPPPVEPRRSSRLAARAAVATVVAEESAAEPEQPSGAAKRLARASLRARTAASARASALERAGGSAKARREGGINWVLPRYCQGERRLARWGRGDDNRPSPRLLPWPGWPEAPDPLGDVPFPLLDCASASWIQCDGCSQWIQVHVEVVTAYRKPQNLAFLCRYLTGVACAGDFRRHGAAAGPPQMPVPRPQGLVAAAARHHPAGKRHLEAGDLPDGDLPDDVDEAPPRPSKRLVLRLRRP
uniref:CW-type domain-containing protein n=1 Tax=Alexandrium catenella TaxID=2925 RepID=A0A7S1QZT0_ALECA